MHDQPSLWKLFTALPRGLAFVIVGVGSFLSTQWKQYTPFGQMLWILAVIAITVDAGISYEFGSTLSYLHAAGFALVALAFCILPDVASMEWRKGRKSTAGWIGFACVPLGMVAFLTHVGYSASIRVGDMQQSDVSNAKYDDTRDAVKDAEGRIKQFSDRIAQLKAANPWITTVSADGLKAQQPALEEAIAQETKRGGCGPKCLGLKQKLADIMEQAGKAEELASHESMLVAAQRGLDKARETAHSATFVSSTAVNHTDTLYKAISFVRGQFVENVTTTERDVTNTGIMGASSIAFLLLAPLFYFAAGLNRRPGVLDAWIYGKEEAPVEAPKPSLATLAPSAPVAGGRIDLSLSDQRELNAFLAKLGNALSLPGPAGAAA
jgi:hypothetical protein